MARIGFSGLGSTEAKQIGFEPLDANAWYTGKVIEAAYKEIGEKATPAINYCVEIRSGPIQKNGDYPEGRRIYGTIWLPKDNDEPKKWENKNKNLKAFLEVTETPMDGDDFDTDAIVGAEIDVKSEHSINPKTGKTHAQVSDFDKSGTHA